MQQQMNRDIQACIDNCLECASTCETTLTYCLNQRGEHAKPEHIKTLMDCVDICYTSVRLMTRGSEQHSVTCLACAEICRACAASCVSMNDEVMKSCAIVCERCALSCESMSGSSGKATQGTQSAVRTGSLDL